MKTEAIYLDNAASTHPKPEQVYQASDRALRQGGSPGRSAHELAVAAAQTVFDCRIKVAEFLGIRNPERLIFTPGCTFAINVVLQRFPFKAGDCVLVSSLEHNAVMRCLHVLAAEKGIEIVQVPYCQGQIMDPAVLEDLLQKRRPRLCVFMEASNVTGELLDLSAVADSCRKHNVPILLDAAQSAGLFNSTLQDDPVAFWTSSAHKGLLGAAGLGLLYVSAQYNLAPFIYGGTGSFSEGFDMPRALPDRFEAGTAPGQLIAALAAGIDYINERGKDNLAAHELSLSSEFISFLKSDSRFQTFAADAYRRLAVVSFSIAGMDSGRVAEILDRKYRICVRAGLHCAASAHRTLGTVDGGLVRVSFGAFNTKEHLAELCLAIGEIADT